MSSYQPDQVGVLTADSMVRVPADATVSEVATAINDNDVGAVVVGLEQVEGIVSERDVVRAVATHRDLDQVRAGDIASTELVRCEARASVDEAAQLMMEGYVRHLVVEDDGAVVGVVSARDVLGALVSR